MVGVIRQVLTIDKVFSKFLIISIIAGIILGIVELIFFYSLKEALNFFNILETKNKWEYNFLNPIYFFLFFALLRLFVSAFTYFWQIYLGGYFKYLVKKNVISFLYTEDQQLKISLKDTSNFLTNISDRGSFCLHHLSSMLSQLFLVVINLFFLIIINYKLFLISSTFLLVLALPILFLSKKLNKLAEIFKISNTEFVKKIFTDSRNILFLKISGVLKKTSILQSELNEKVLNSQKDYQLKFSLLGQVPFFLGVIIFFIILYVNRTFLNIETGSLIVFIFLFFRICISAGNIITAQGNIKFDFPFIKEYKNLVDILNKQKFIKNGHLNIIPKSLKTKDLIIKRGSFQKQIPDISIKQGEIFSILGTSGTGKSTLILTLFGILEKYKGEIIWNDNGIEKLNIYDFYKKISFCGTDPFLIKGTLEDNLYYGLDKLNNSYEDYKKLIEVCDADFLKNIDVKNKILDDEGLSFSSGQRQKISLIRALLKKPEVLILDEATSNIDLISEEKIIKNIIETYPNIIIIATTHRPGILVSDNKIQLF